MDLGLGGKVAIVTGGGSNIGRGISTRLAGEGAKVVIAEVDEAQAQKVVSEIKSAGGEAKVIKTDVTNFDSVKAMVKATADTYGRVDILVNNVGWDQMAFFKDIPVDTIQQFAEKVIALNYFSVIYNIKAALEYMIPQNYGKIINIGSDAGRVGELREPIYSGSKGGVIALSKSLARELGRNGININVVCPGTTPPKPDAVGEKSMWNSPALAAAFTPEYFEKAAKSFPIKRVGTAEDISAAVAFFASDLAGFITGQTLSVSGGYSMM